MKKYNFIMICALLTFSCKKTKTDTEPCQLEPQTQLPASNSMIPLKAGNYWIYQHGRQDTLGFTYAINDFDSVYVEKDTLIAGVTYYKMGHTNSIFQNFSYYGLGSADTFTYLKDSAGYFVSLTGNMVLDPVHLHDTIRKFTYSPIDYSCTVPNVFTQKHFLLGQYSGNSMDQIYHRNAPGNAIIDTACSTYFVANIGIVKSYYSYTACLRHCRYNYTLIRYHLN